MSIYHIIILPSDDGRNGLCFRLNFSGCFWYFFYSFLFFLFFLLFFPFSEMSGRKREGGEESSMGIV